MRSALLLALALVAGAVVAPAAAQAPGPADDYDPATDVRVSYDVGLVEDSSGLVVTATVDLPSSVHEFDFRPPTGATVVATDGFEGTDEGYRWTDDVATPSLTYRLDPGPAAQRAVAMADGWAVFRRSAVTGTGEWLYAGDEPTLHRRVDVVGDAPGFVGDAIVLLGDYETVDGTGDADGFRVLVPNGATVRADPAAVFDSLAFARRHLDVGHDHDRLTGLVFSTRLRSRGFAPRGLPEFAVHEDERPRGADNVWIHEYVHTRQGFSTTPDSRGSSRAAPSTRRRC